MDNYLLLKSLHVLGVVIFLGNIIVPSLPDSGGQSPGGLQRCGLFLSALQFPPRSENVDNSGATHRCSIFEILATEGTR
jgi:hypothetical protein